MSQLGALLKREHPRVMRRAGVSKLKEYVENARRRGIVWTGWENDAATDNGNMWVALHPAFHGKPAEPQHPLQQFPPPNVMTRL